MNNFNSLSIVDKGAGILKAYKVLEYFPKYRQLFQGIPKDIELYIENYSKNTIIVQRGDLVEKVMILASGDMVVYNEYIDGEIMYVQTDDVTFIGDIELIAGQDSFVCSVSARNDCQAVVMSIEDFLRWFDTDPILMKEMATRLAKRNCIQSSKIGTLKYQSTEHRVIKFLVDKLSSLKFINGKATIKVTREVIAFQVGASERMIHRIIRKLKHENLISTGYGTIIINEEKYHELVKML